MGYWVIDYLEPAKKHVLADLILPGLRAGTGPSPLLKFFLPMKILHPRQ